MWLHIAAIAFCQLPWFCTYMLLEVWARNSWWGILSSEQITKYRWHWLTCQVLFLYCGKTPPVYMYCTVHIKICTVLALLDCSKTLAIFGNCDLLVCYHWDISGGCIIRCYYIQQSWSLQCVTGLNTPRSMCIFIWSWICKIVQQAETRAGRSLAMS